MNKGQEAYANIDHQIGHLLVQIDTFYQYLPKPIQEAYDMLGSTVSYGCHVDLEPEQEPDGCVIISGEFHNCIYAKEGMRPEQCEYWRTIAPKMNREIP